MEQKVLEINRMLDLIMASSKEMPNHVFRFFVDSKRPMREKPFYNLLADGFLTLFSFCLLMRNEAWSQAFALLRIGIEQVSAIYLMATKPGALSKYLELIDLKSEFSSLCSDKERKIFCSNHDIPKNRYNEYLDYHWVSSFSDDGEYGRNTMIKLARLDEFIVDIEQTLNAFSHGSISVFQMSGENWNVMKRYGRRACLSCCKLFDFLCCSYRWVIGDEEFGKLPLNAFFLQLKDLYLDLSFREDWK